MNKNADIPEVLRFGTVEAETMQQKANLLNEYYQSVYSQPCKISTRQTSEVTLLEKSELLPLSLFLQIMDLLHLSKLCQNDRQTTKLFEKNIEPKIADVQIRTTKS